MISLNAEGSGSTLLAATRTLLSGLLLATVLAVAAQFIAEHHGGPPLLHSLLLGIAFNAYSGDTRAAPGLAFSCSSVLRIGVALLGVRITFGEVAALGASTFALVVGAVASTIGVGWAIARALRLDRAHAMVSAGAVAICGASAALAIAAAVPRGRLHESQIALTVAGVAAIGSLAMILYPVLVQAIGFDAREAGIFVGATIHDVAQAVGAAHMISDDAAHVAAVVKLLRVALLAPVIVGVAWLFRAPQSAQRPHRRLVPGFLLAYVVLLIANSLQLIPAWLTHVLAELSAWCLAIAVAALGTHIRVPDLLAIGARPLIAMCAQSAWLALWVGAWLLLTRAAPGA